MAAPSGYGYYVDVDIATTADVSNAVFDIDLSEMPSSFWTNLGRTDGGDIYTTDISDTKLDRDVSGLNTTTEVGWVHVRGDASASGTTIRIYYGNASGSETNATTTWTTAGYNRVYHLNESSGTTLADAAGNGDATLDSTNHTIGATGKLNTCLQTNTAATQRSTASSPGGTSYTAEGWLYCISTTSGFSVIVGWVNNNNVNVAISQYANKIRVYFDGGSSTHWSYVDTASVTTYVGTWYHLVVTHNYGDATPSVYVNGSNATLGGVAIYPNLSPYAGLSIGNFNDYNISSNATRYDEIRVGTSVRSASAIAISYNCQAKTTSYVTYGTEQTVTSAGVAGTRSRSGTVLGIKTNLVGGGFTRSRTGTLLGIKRGVR
jgi:hypothetical protein